MPGRERDIRLHVKTDSDNRGLVRAANDLEKLSRGADTASDKFHDFSSDTKRLGAEIERTKNHIHDLRLQIAKTGDESLFRDLGKEERRLQRLTNVFDSLVGSTDDVSRGADKAGRSFQSLSAEIEHTRTRIHELQVQISKTGDVGLFGNLDKEEHKLRKLQKLAMDLGGEAGVQGGRLFLAGFVDSIGALPSQLKGAFIAGVAGVAVIAAPVLGAAIAGAVTGLVGFGGIIGGIAQASKDPRVRDAASHFGAEISKEFFTTGGHFVDPIIDSLGILESEFKKLNLGFAFSKAAPFVDDLAKAIGGFANNIMPGLNEAFDNLGPFIDVIAKELPELGDAFGDMLADISESEGAVKGLHAAFEFIEATLRVTGDAISFLSDRFDEMLGFLQKIGPPIEKFLSIAGHINPLFAGAADVVHAANKEIAEIAAGSGPASDGLDGLGSSASKTEDAAKLLQEQLEATNKEIADTARVAFSAEDATLDFEEGLDKLRGAASDGNKSLSIYNKSGRDNRRVLGEIVTAAYQARDAIIDEGNGTETARKKGDEQFNKMIAKAREVALKLGLPKGAVDALIESLNKIPAKKAPKISTPGVDAAITRIGLLDAALERLHGKTIVINTKFRYGPKPIPLQHGGPALAGHPYVVGEKRPELFVPDRNGRIEPKVPTRIAQRAGGNTYNINVTAGLADPRLVATQVVEAIQYYQKRNGSGWTVA